MLVNTFVWRNRIIRVIAGIGFFPGLLLAGTISWVGTVDVPVDIYKNQHYDGRLYLRAGMREAVVVPPESEIEWMVVHAQTRYPLCRFVLEQGKSLEITVTPQGCAVKE